MILAQKYLVEAPVAGQSGGVAVRNYVDPMDVNGCIVDLKTASKKPSAPRALFEDEGETGMKQDFDEDPEPADEDDPEYQEEMFQTFKVMKCKPDEIKDPKYRQLYAEWLKKQEN